MAQKLSTDHVTKFAAQPGVRVSRRRLLFGTGAAAISASTVAALFAFHNSLEDPVVGYVLNKLPLEDRLVGHILNKHLPEARFAPDDLSQLRKDVLADKFNDVYARRTFRRLALMASMVNPDLAFAGVRFERRYYEGLERLVVTYAIVGSNFLHRDKADAPLRYAGIPDACGNPFARFDLPTG